MTRIRVLSVFGAVLALLVTQSSGEVLAQTLSHRPNEISGGAAEANKAPRLLSIPGTAGGERLPGLEPLTFVPGPGFVGYDFVTNTTETGGFVFIPPDPIGAAGLDRLVAVVNVGIECKSKTGIVLFRDSLQDFFSSLGSPATLGTFTFDPKVVYDPYEDRFVVVTLERQFLSQGDPADDSRILIAVSKDSTPSSATSADWWYHSINSKINIGQPPRAHWVDYPGFEVDEEAVYITGNMFPFTSGNGGVRLWIVDKGTTGGFYDGGAAAVTIHDPVVGGAFGVTMMPAKVFSGIGGGLMSPSGVGTYLVGYSGLSTGGPGGQEAIQVIRVNNPLGSVSFTDEIVFMGDLEDVAAELPDGPQLGEATGIEVNDRRVYDAVWRDNSLWATTVIDPNAVGDATNAGQATVHWVRVNTSAVTSGASAAGLLTLADQGNIGGEDIATATSTFFPSVAVNHLGEAKFGFSATAATIYCGAYFAGRQASDPAGTVQASGVVQAGQAPYLRLFSDPRNRWGDYSGMSVDPSDERIFWAFNEYAWTQGTPAGTGTGRWKTAWRACATSCFSPICPPDTTVTGGDTASRNLCIVNCGALAETFTYVISDEAGWCSGSASGVLVAAGDTTCISVDCTVPVDACSPDSTVLKIVITSSAGEVDSCTTVIRAAGGGSILDFSPLSSTLGTVAVGDTTCQGFTIRNLGCQDLNISSVTGCDTLGFFLDLSLLTTPVMAGDSTEFRVCFSPVQSGAVSCSVFVATDGGNSGAEVRIDATTAVPGEETVSSRLRLAAWPNPITGAAQAEIQFGLTREGPARISVFNAAGRLVDIVADSRYPAGIHSVRWDARAQDGSRVASGQYYYRLETEEGTVSQKLLILK